MSCASCKTHGYHSDDGWYCCACNPCFPAAARLSLESGETLPMSELEVGDKVQTGMKSVTMSELQVGDRGQTGRNI